MTIVISAITKDQCTSTGLSCFDPFPTGPYDQPDREHIHERPESMQATVMPNSTTLKKDRGFSLLEILIVVAVIIILGALAVPRVMNTVSDVNLRYFATNFSGLLQSARMQA